MKLQSVFITIVLTTGAVVAIAAEQRFPVFSTGFAQAEDRETAKQNAEADAAAKLICGGELGNVQNSTNCNVVKIGDQTSWTCNTSARGTCVMHKDADQTIRIIR